MDLWKTNFPPTEAADYYRNPRDLPAFWGIHPSEFHPDRCSDILQRFKKAMLILHPDKHANCPP